MRVVPIKIYGVIIYFLVQSTIPQNCLYYIFYNTSKLKTLKYQDTMQNQ